MLISHGINEPGHAPRNGRSQALPIVGPIDPRRFHVIGDKAALNQNCWQNILLNDDKPRPFHSTISRGISGVKFDNFRVDHRGQQDVLRIVIVAWKFLDVGTRQLGGGSRRSPAGR